MASEKNRSTEFLTRLESRYDELKWLYCEVYNNDMQSFDALIESIGSFYESRRAGLKKLDRKAEDDPFRNGTNKLVGMMMYVDNFAGNLKNLKGKLDYIKESGVNYLHLMPLLKCPKERSDGGYAVSDFRCVQTELGTMKDLEELSKECHKNGISLCLDFVMNHTSEEHEWAKAARAGDPEAQRRYFFFDDWGIPSKYDETVPQVFPATAPGNFTYLHDCGKIVMTTFHPYQWDLNYSNSAVFNDMVGNMLYIANMGIDVIRLDAVPYIWKQLGTTCRNLPRVHTLVRMMRLISEIVCPSVLLLGEVVMEPSKVVPYFGTPEKPECHMLYNVTTMATIWHTVATKDVRLLKKQMEQISWLPKNYVFLNYLRCHDDIGWGLDYAYLGNFFMSEVPHKRFLNDYFTGNFGGSRSHGELYNNDERIGDARLCGTTASLCGIEDAINKNDQYQLDISVDCDVLLHAFMFTLSGIPVIYSGDEVAQLNDYSYHDDPDKAADSRYLHRGKFDWDLAAKRNDESSVQGRVYLSLSKLEKIRSDHPVFTAGASFCTLETYSDNVLGIKREYSDQTLYCYFNFADSYRQFSFGAEVSGKDLISGNDISGNSYELKPYGFMWILSE